MTNPLLERLTEEDIHTIDQALRHCSKQGAFIYALDGETQVDFSEVRYKLGNILQNQKLVENSIRIGLEQIKEMNVPLKESESYIIPDDIEIAGDGVHKYLRKTDLEKLLKWCKDVK